MATKRDRDVINGETTWGPWRVQVSWQVRQGVPTPVGMCIEPADPGDTTSRLDSATVRRLPFGELAKQTRQHAHGRALDGLEVLVAAVRHGGRAAVPKTVAALRGAIDDSVALEGRATGRGLSDDDYRQVAELYRAAVKAGTPPLQAVMAARQIEKSTAAKQVARARQRGYLPKTTKGRVGPLTEEQS